MQTGLHLTRAALPDKGLLQPDSDASPERIEADPQMLPPSIPFVRAQTGFRDSNTVCIGVACV